MVGDVRNFIRVQAQIQWMKNAACNGNTKISLEMRVMVPHECGYPFTALQPGSGERLGQAARPLASLGYKQAMQYLRGELSLEEAILAAQQGHRNYAKRQMTWFRREPDVKWFGGFGSDAQIQEATEKFIKSQKA